MEIIFIIVYSSLCIVSYITGFSYQEVNVLFYYFVIPYSYLVISDFIFNCHFGKIVYFFCFVILMLSIDNFSLFCDSVFVQSVNFLDSFYPDFNYVESSVIFCVIVPFLIYILLFRFSPFRKFFC
jgi:hypothetical protein